MAKKTYVSPGIMLLAANGGDPGATSVHYNPDNDPSLGAKPEDLDFEDFEYSESLWGDR